MGAWSCPPEERCGIAGARVVQGGMRSLRSGVLGVRPGRGCKLKPFIRCPWRRPYANNPSWIRLCLWHPSAKLRLFGVHVVRWRFTVLSGDEEGRSCSGRCSSLAAKERTSGYRG